MILLAIDTSASVCAAGVYEGETELAREAPDIGKGHAEHLMAVIDAALQRAGKSYADLGRIVVAVGPGSFTGIRVGVSAARGLALATGVPAVGVSNLEAIAAEARGRHGGRPILAAFASIHDTVQAAVYDPFAKLVYDPSIMTLAEAARLAVDRNAVIVGSAGPALAAMDPRIEVDAPAITADIATYAALGRAKAAGDKPRPLYLRAPDAKPQAGFALPRAGA